MTDRPVIQLSPADMERLSRLAFTLSHNENTRDEFAGLVQKVDKTAAKAFGDVFLRQEFKQLKTDIENERLADKMQRIATARNAQKAQVIAKRKLSTEQVAAIDKIMQHYSLPDWEAGADIYAQRNPPPNPQLQPPPELMDGGSTWEFPTVTGPDGKQLAFKDFIAAPSKWAKDTAYKMITDFKRQRLPAAFSR